MSVPHTTNFTTDIGSVTQDGSNTADGFEAVKRNKK
jgi:hypothetical protein